MTQGEVLVRAAGTLRVVFAGARITLYQNIMHFEGPLLEWWLEGRTEGIQDRRAKAGSA